MQKKKTVQENVKYTFAAAGQAIITGSQNPVQQLFDSNQSLAQLFNTAFKAALIIGAILAVVRLIYAGAIYMTTDLPGAKGNAKEIIGEAMMGLLLLLAVWLILYQINPNILNLNILQNVQNNPIPASSALPSGAPCSAAAGPCPGGFQ